MDDGVVGPQQRRDDFVRTEVLRLAVQLRHDINGHRTGDIASGVTPHAIRDRDYPPPANT